jgi:hypothetical protein
MLRTLKRLSSNQALQRSVDSSVSSLSSASSLAIDLPKNTSPTIFAGGVAIGPLLEENFEIAPIQTSVENLRTNIPSHVRKSLKLPSVGSSLQSSQNQSWMSKMFLRTENSEITYREAQLLLVKGKPGQITAYNYPRCSIPVEIAMRIPENIRVEQLQWGTKAKYLLDLLKEDKFTLIFTFSGDGQYSGISSGIKHWQNALKDIEKGPKPVMLHFHSSWLARRLHMMTRLSLRAFSDERVYVYRGKWTTEIAKIFHVYNSQLPSILLADQRGFIRWHAVGLPTEESVEILKSILKS